MGTTRRKNSRRKSTTAFSVDRLVYVRGSKANVDKVILLYLANPTGLLR